MRKIEKGGVSISKKPRVHNLLVRKKTVNRMASRTDMVSIMKVVRLLLLSRDKYGSEYDKEDTIANFSDYNQNIKSVKRNNWLK